MASRQDSYAGSSAVLGQVRGDTSLWLSDQGVSREATDRAMLVVSELSSNAIDASPGQDFTVDLARIGAASISISVTNMVQAGIKIPTMLAMTDPLSTRGRGLPIVSALAQKRPSVTHHAGQVTVCAHLAV